MSENHGSNGVPSMFTDERELAWMEEHLAELKQSVAGPRILYASLLISFMVGLAAHIGGYLLLSSVGTGLLGLLADLLHALGWSLWTGAVVAMFVQVVPEINRRQISQALAAYEALRRERAAGNRSGAALESPRARRAEGAARKATSKSHAKKK